MIREPVVVVAGHVDHGKTSLLDAIRGSTVASKEAGGITQHIGATKVPLENIKKISGNLIKKYNFNLTIPGLLFIDTPGHEAFSFLRKRGCSVSDIAILIIDIMQGVQPQTNEVIENLKERKIPFVVALTKIDSIKGFNKLNSLSEILKEVDEGKTLYSQIFNEKMYKIIGQLGEKGFNSDRFDKVKDFTKEVILIPISAKQNVGLEELLMFLAGLAQRFLEQTLRLNIDGAGIATVLEVKDEKGFGRTLDVILHDGIIKKDDYIKIESNGRVILTKVKMLLRPKPMQEMRNNKDKFDNCESINAASGFKLVANNLENVNAGDDIYVISYEDSKKLETKLNKMDNVNEKGIIAKVDTEGSKNALIEMAKTNDVDIYRVDVGSVNREDILEAELLREKDFKYGAILSFNLKILPEIEDLCKKKGIKLFSSQIIYRIFEEYKNWEKKSYDNIKENELKDVVYPAELKILPQYIFRKSKPLVVGVEIIEGKLRTNSKVIMNGEELGILKKIQENGKDVKEAIKGKEVAVSIEGADFEKININLPIYTYIPISQREIIKKYLKGEYPDLIKKLDEIYLKM